MAKEKANIIQNYKNPRVNYKLDILIENIHSNKAKTRNLILKNMWLNHYDAVRLSANIICHTKLKEIFLHDIEFNEDSIIIFCESLKLSNKIYSFHANYISPERNRDIIAIFNTLTSVSLINLNIVNEQTVVELLTVNNTLSWLHLPDNRGVPIYEKGLLQLLQANTRLVDLGEMGNEFCEYETKINYYGSRAAYNQVFFTCLLAHKINSSCISVIPIEIICMILNLVKAEVPGQSEKEFEKNPYCKPFPITPRYFQLAKGWREKKLTQENYIKYINQFHKCIYSSKLPYREAIKRNQTIITHAMLSDCPREIKLKALDCALFVNAGRLCDTQTDYFANVAFTLAKQLCSKENPQDLTGNVISPEDVIRQRCRLMEERNVCLERESDDCKLM